MVKLNAKTEFPKQGGRAITLKDLQKGGAMSVFRFFFGGNDGELREDFFFHLP
jgi:hypothetical protein